MSRGTVRALFKCFENDTIPVLPVLADYWGNAIGDEKSIGIVFGVYQGLYMMGIDADMFHKCYLANRLDELIHKKYTHHKSRYYTEFVKRNIVIGKTYYNIRPPEREGDEKDVSNAEAFEISDGNTCPSCDTGDYYTVNYIKNAPPDCAVCCKMICELCSRHDEEGSNTCLKCIDRLAAQKQKRKQKRKGKGKAA
jgi:hypothetical protein